MILDHACYAGRNLAELRQRFFRLGLASEYGGCHATATHMALVTFADGSYIELLAPADGTSHTSIQHKWGQLILADAGPCAWAVRVPSVTDELKRLARMGKPVSGPTPGARVKPDGRRLEWESGYVLPDAPGALLPFFISDITGYQYRIAPSSIGNKAFEGIAKVLIAVSEIESSIREFREAHDLDLPEIEENEFLQARLASFAGSPVILAMALGPSELAERTTKYGNRPAAFLLSTKDLASASESFGLTKPMRVGRFEIAWFNPKPLGGMRLGAVQA